MLSTTYILVKLKFAFYYYKLLVIKNEIDENKKLVRVALDFEKL
jgi:hypothetical protein